MYHNIELILRLAIDIFVTTKKDKTKNALVYLNVRVDQLNTTSDEKMLGH